MFAQVGVLSGTWSQWCAFQAPGLGLAGFTDPPKVVTGQLSFGVRGPKGQLCSHSPDMLGCTCTA